MKKNLLFYFAFLFTIFAQAQTETYFIDWSFNSTPSANGDANSDRTIEVGDTVTWVWYANGTHNVVSDNDATESFSSALMGPGSEFSHTFTQVGTNAYVCTPHPGSMFGTITVVPDGTLNLNDFSRFENISFFPNPAKDRVFLDIGRNNNLNIEFEIYNTLGQRVMKFQKNVTENTSIDISQLYAGLYFVNLKDGENSVTKKLIIK